VLFGGIDVGSLTTQAVIMKNGELLEFRSLPVKPNPIDSAKTVMGALLQELKLKWHDLTFCVSTGYGREEVQREGLSQGNVSEISCHGKGAHWLLPEVRTVIDIGGQDAKVILIDQKGELVDFVMNDKCAAGTGRFLEVMSRVLGVSLAEMGTFSLRGKNTVHLSSRCGIFCETEVLHYLQRGIDKADIAAGISRSMAERIMVLARRLSLNREVTMTGGVAKNVAVRKELEKAMNLKMAIYSVDPQVVGALGAALFAQKIGGNK
jgi:predicted CoA-substrate-specific enzyme activase